MEKTKSKSYRSRPIRKTRRSKAEIDELKALLYDTVEEYRPMTVRQIFYQMVSRGAIDKKESEYKGTVVRLLTEMRKAGELPYEWIADATRWMRKPNTWSSVDKMLRNAQESYRRSLWDNQDVYVEVWLEKEALAGTLYHVTGEWDVPLMVTRGYSSISYLYSAADVIESQGKPTYLYYFGDHDPSGVDITRNVEQTLRERAPSAEIYFTKVAVTADQIITMNLPTRPTKKTDSRSKGFVGESIEVDAIRPPVLRNMVREAIEQHIDIDAYESLKIVEEQERESLLAVNDFMKHRRRE